MPLPIEGDPFPPETRVETGVWRRADATTSWEGTLLADLELVRAALEERGDPASRRAIDDLDELVEALHALEPERREDVERAVSPWREAIRALADARLLSKARSTRDRAVLLARLRSVIGRSAEGDSEAALPRVRYVRGDLAAWIAQITSALAGLARERGVELTVTCPTRLGGEVDPDHFARILVGLVVEALADSPPGSRVSLRVRVCAGDIEVTVSESAEAARGRAPRARASAARPDAVGIDELADLIEGIGGTFVVTRSPRGGRRMQVALPRRAPAGIEVTVASEPADASELAQLVVALPSTASPAATRDPDRAKRDFLGMVSHELRTPVTSMRLHLRMLEREGGASLTPSVRRRLERINRSKHRLQFLIETMLECSRYQDLQLTPLVRRFDARRLAAAVIDELSDAGAPRRLSLAPGGATQEPELASDARLLRLILLNVLTLALERGGEAPVVLGVETDGGIHRFRVAHGGRLFSASERRELFAPLEVDVALHLRAGSGSGLGLSLVRDLAHALDGRLAIGSPSSIEVSVPSLALPSGDGDATSRAAAR